MNDTSNTRSRKGTRRGLHWHGTAPKNANAVIYADDEEGSTRPLAGWAIYRCASSAGPWVALKIVRLGAGQGAANYWTGWNTEEHRLSRRWGTERIPADMRQAIEDVMRDLYPHLTEQELVDELARVRLLA